MLAGWGRWRSRYLGRAGGLAADYPRVEGRNAASPAQERSQLPGDRLENAPLFGLHLDIGERPVRGLEGQREGQTLLAGGKLLAPVDVKEPDIREERSAGSPDRRGERGRRDRFLDHQGHILQHRREPGNGAPGGPA